MIVNKHATLPGVSLPVEISSFYFAAIVRFAFESWLPLRKEIRENTPGKIIRSDEAVTIARLLLSLFRTPPHRCSSSAGVEVLGEGKSR